LKSQVVRTITSKRYWQGHNSDKRGKILDVRLTNRPIDSRQYLSCILEWRKKPILVETSKEICQDAISHLLLGSGKLSPIRVVGCQRRLDSHLWEIG